MPDKNNKPPYPPHIKFYQGLERSQWWSDEKLQAYQAMQLKRLLKYARQTTRYWRDNLFEMDIADKPDNDISFWQKLPVLTRETLQSSFENLCSTQLPDGHGPVYTISTSGSTGTPVQALQSKLSNIIWQANTLRDHVWHDRDLTGKLAILRSIHNKHDISTEGKILKGWGPATRPYNNGDSYILPVNLPIDEQANWLIRTNPNYILTYPSNAFALADYFLNNRLSLPNLKEVRTLGEPVNDSIRINIAEAWGVKITDIYSSQEAGYLALQCSDNNHYHIQSESIYLEVLDNHGHPCQAGETGRVVVTPLHNYAMPLIRYEIGDYAEPGETCSCGRRLPVLKQILGRTRNLIMLPDGKRIWPSTGIQDYRNLAPIIQAQLIQKRLAHLELIIKTERPLNNDERHALSELLKSKTSHEFKVNIIEKDDIPRSENGKFEDVICNIK